MPEYIDPDSGEVWEESPPVGERTGFTAEQADELKAKLDRRRVSQRTQAGRSLSYIEGWWAIREANRIFGFDGWQRETTYMQVVAEREAKIGQPPKQRDGWAVAYIARVRIRVLAGNAWLVREGTGYGSGVDASIGQAHESAVKEAETDAMKRALMTFGNPFGLALYDKTQAEVAAPVQQHRPQISQELAQQTTPDLRNGMPAPPMKEAVLASRAEAWEKYTTFRQAVTKTTSDEELDILFASQDWRDLQTALLALGEGKRIDTIIKMRNDKMSDQA